MAYIDRALDSDDDGIDKATFRTEAEAETVHLRKGLIDEWREVFTPAQQARAWDHSRRHGRAVTAGVA